MLHFKLRTLKSHDLNQFHQHSLLMKIGIIALGWLGNQIFEGLTKKTTHDVIGTYRSTPRQNDRPTIPYNLGETLPIELQNLDSYLLCVPPGIRRNPDQKEDLLTLHQQFIQQIPTSSQLIYTSSTSVYTESKQNLDETAKVSGGVSEIEELVRQHPKHLIFRLGGLAGPNRPIVNLLQKRGQINGYNAPTNLLHLDDACSFITEGIIKQKTGVFNLCSPDHPTKQEVYNHWNKRLGYPLLPMGEPSKTIKTVSSKKLSDQFETTFQFCNPMDFKF